MEGILYESLKVCLGATYYFMTTATCFPKGQLIQNSQALSNFQCKVAKLMFFFVDEINKLMYCLLVVIN